MHFDEISVFIYRDSFGVKLLVTTEGPFCDYLVNTWETLEDHIIISGHSGATWVNLGNTLRPLDDQVLFTVRAPISFDFIVILW